MIKKYDITYGSTAYLHKYEYTYDNNNQLIEWWGETLKNGVWQKGTRRLITYYEVGKAKDTIQQVWNWDDNIWINYEKCIMEYEDENIVSRTFQVIEYGNWMNDYKKEYHYHFYIF